MLHSFNFFLILGVLLDICSSAVAVFTCSSSCCMTLQWQSLVFLCIIFSISIISTLLSSISTLDTGFLPRPSVVCLSVCLSICWSVCLESVLWQNGWVDLDAFWGGELGYSKDGCIRWWWLSLKGSFGGEFGASHCNQWGFCCVVVRKCMNRWSCHLKWWVGSVAAWVD